MSKNNNVNPGQYKVAGRERPGKGIPEPERSKPELSSVAGAKRGSARGSRSARQSSRARPR